MSIVSTILGVESGGRNITQGNIGDINNARGTLAQGYFQITDPTWAQFGGLSTGYTSALQAPYATQLQVAQNIPVARWGQNTQSALLAAGYAPSQGQTLGQLMAANGETTAGDIANGPADASSGVAGGSSATSGTTGYSVTQNPAGTGTTTTAPAAQGAPIQTALQPEETSFITSTVQGIESAFGGGLTKAITAAETGVATYLGGLQNWFTRAALILLGIVIVAIALAAIMWDHGGKQAVVTAGRAVAA